MADQLPTVLTTDHLIQLAHVECLHRSRAALVARKLGEEISPCNRCLVYTKYGAWNWEQGQGQGQGGDNGALAAHDTAPPQNGIEDEQEDPSSQSSTATLKVTDERFRACDAVLFYACLPYVLDPANGFPEPSDQWPRVPVALFEAKTNASRQLGGEQRSAELAIELEKAREQLGEQAGFMFGDHRFQGQPFIIGIAMVAEAWSYAFFDRDQRPELFDLDCVWLLPEEEWTPQVLWGTSESNANFSDVVNAVAILLTEMQIPLI